MRADARRNYDRIVAAAREELSQRGTDASYDDIAKRAGVGAGTLYRHFPRRIDLVQAVYSDDIDTLVIAADKAELAPDAFVGLEQWLHAFVRYANTKRVLLNEMHEAFERDPKLRVQLRERMLTAAGRVLKRAQASNAVRRDITPDDLLQLVGGMCLSAAATPASNKRLLPVILEGLRTDS
jgi:AcrR family transcriptional regulator